MIHDESLEPIDYVILGIVRSGVTKIQSIFKRLPKVSNWTIEKKVTNLKKLGLLELNEKDNWFARKLDPQFSLTDNGNNVIDKKIDELKGEYDKLVLLYENEDKEKLREGMDSNKMFFPFMMLMGITNGMMFGSMLGMNHMMMGDYMQNTYDQGYMDGMGDDGFMDGFTDGDGGSMDGGGEGGFMDGGFDVGF
tara:strand:- start:12 stop:590 length:579 start_codon:yes stop_codon:yes gene_type:complete